MGKRNTKIAAWYGLITLFAVWLWSFKKTASFNSITGLEIDMLSLLVFLFLTTIFALGIMLFQKQREIILAAVIVSLVFLFNFGFTLLNLLGVIVLILLTLFSRKRVLNELNTRLKLDIRRAIHVAAWPVIVGLFILISFAAYQSPLAEQIKSNKTLSSQLQVALKQVVEKTAGSEFDFVSERERQQIFQEVANRTFQTINDSLRPYFEYAPPLLAFGLFLILFGFSWIFTILASILGLILFQILKKSRVVQIQQRDVKAEVLAI